MKLFFLHISFIIEKKKSNNIPFDFEKVLKLIQCLDSNKANLHYEISFKVLKLVSFFIIIAFFI